MTRVLFVGTAENRYYNEISYDPELNDMPTLINKDGTIVDELNELTEIEKYKSFIFKKLGLDKNTKYNTVDPEYSINNKKKEHDTNNYLGHYDCLLEDLDNSLEFKFDYIIITSCYDNLFNQTNIDKLNQLSKYSNRIYILKGVPYTISDYMKNNLFYEFMNL